MLHLTRVENSNASLAIKSAAPLRNATFERNNCAIIPITAKPLRGYKKDKMRKN